MDIRSIVQVASIAGIGASRRRKTSTYRRSTVSARRLSHLSTSLVRCHVISCNPLQIGLCRYRSPHGEGLRREGPQLHRGVLLWRPMGSYRPGRQPEATVGASRSHHPAMERAPRFPKLHALRFEGVGQRPLGQEGADQTERNRVHRPSAVRTAVEFDPACELPITSDPGARSGLQVGRSPLPAARSLPPISYPSPAGSGGRSTGRSGPVAR
jgi:hypothetical protein